VLSEFWSDIRYRLRAILRRGVVERDLDDELRFHIEREAEKYVAQGMTPDEAMRRARSAFGGLDQIKEDARDTRGVGWIENFFQDLRYALRQLTRRPGFAAVVVATLALGIGANTSIFSVVNAVLFRPLPFDDSQRLVLVSEGFSGLASDFQRVTAADYLDFREAEGRTFEAVALIAGRDAILVGDSDPEVVRAAAVTPSLFRVLRVTPAVGRPFNEMDAEPGAPRVAILSNRLWRQRFGADPGVVGKTISFASGSSAQIVGIMPADFHLPLPGVGGNIGEVLFPFAFTSGVLAQRGDSYDAHMVGRLRGRVSVAQARESLAAVAHQLPARYPETYGGIDPAVGDLIVNIAHLRNAAVADAKRPLLLLLGAVGLVLLISCINVATLLVARTTSRRNEIAVRRALGASRARLARQFLAESLVLVVLGGTLGAWVATWGGRALAAAAPDQFYSTFDISFDGRVLAFTLTVAAMAAVVFSLLPTLHASGAEAHEHLRDANRFTSGSRTRRRSLRALVATEIAMATMLAVSAGLLVRSFAHVHALDPGFDAERLLTFRVTFPGARYPDGARVALAQRQLALRLQEVPVVHSATATTHAPLSGLWQIGFTPEGDPLSHVPVAANALVLPDYFETLDVPLRAGRTFDPQDAGETPPVVIISETLARQYYGTVDAVGRKFKWGTRQTRSPWSTIVGVVGDVKQVRLDEQPFPSVYMPRLQLDTVNFWHSATYVVRTTVPSATSVPLLREAVKEFDPELLLLDLSEMEALIAASVADRRFNLVLFGLFAAVALTLAGIGVYGVMQFSVARRTREMGIRMAFGARRPDLLCLVVGDASRVAVVGVGIGLAGAFALTRIMRSLLFETSPLDALTFIAAASVLLLTALLAGYVPARHALRADLIMTLRNE